MYSTAVPGASTGGCRLGWEKELEMTRILEEMQDVRRVRTASASS